jgi:hypothetical protein
MTTSSEELSSAEDTCPYCLAEVDGKATVCHTCRRDIYLVLTLQRRVIELELLVSKSKPQSENGSPTAEGATNSFAVITILYLILVSAITYVTYSPTFGDRDMAFHMNIIFLCSLIFGFIGILLRGPRNAFVLAIISTFLTMIMLLVVKMAGSFTDIEAYTANLESNALRVAIVSLLGSLFGSFYSRTTSIRDVFNVKRLFKKLQGPQNVLEKVETLILRTSFGLTLSIWIASHLFPDIL